MITSKKGISQVILVVMFVALALVLVAIVWGVIGNMIGEQTQEMELSNKCMDVTVRPTNAICGNGTENILCNITLKREDSKSSVTFPGVALRFQNESESNLVYREGSVGALSTITIRNFDTGFGNGGNLGTITAIVYFEDSVGNRQLCPAGASYNL